jgi:hypothetical protein
MIRCFGGNHQRMSHGGAGVFVLLGLVLLAALAAFWWVATWESGGIQDQTAKTEAQVFEGLLHRPEGTVIASGSRFLIAAVKGLTLACTEPTGLRRIDDVEMRLRPCRFQMLESGIRVEEGGLQVWVYKKGTLFEAETSAALFGVLGTRFDLEVLPDQTARVRVIEGEVLVKARKSNASKKVQAGSGLQVSLGGDIQVFPAQVAPAPDPDIASPSAPGGPQPDLVPAPPAAGFGSSSMGVPGQGSTVATASSPIVEPESEPEPEDDGLSSPDGDTEMDELLGGTSTKP